MSFEWPVLPLEECLEALIDYRGKTPEKTDSGVPLVTAKIIKSGRIEKASEFIAKDNYDTWMRRGISLISMAGISALFEIYERYIKGKFSLKAFNISSKKRLSKYIFISLLTSAISGLSVLLSIPLMLALMIVLSSFFSMVPMIGLSAGTKHIQDDVILPKQCAPILSREDRVKNIGLKKSNKKTETYAQCIKIIDGEKTIASGRIVYSTTDVIVLFDPDTGAVWREAIGNRTIEAVSQLPAKKLSDNAHM